MNVCVMFAYVCVGNRTIYAILYSSFILRRVLRCILFVDFAVGLLPHCCQTVSNVIFSYNTRTNVESESYKTVSASTGTITIIMEWNREIAIRHTCDVPTVVSEG